MFYYLDDFKAANKALIIHSGALGDCVLTLKMAAFLREVLKIDVINFIGPGDYISFMPGRTVINSIRNIHTLRLEKMFADPEEFEIEEDDPLIKIFSGYNWIISFLGGSNSNFETNLAYLACFTSSPEIVMLTARPGQGSEKHISDMHIEELINLKKPSMEAMGIEEADMQAAHFDAMISPNLNDIQQGLAILSDRAALGHKDDKVAILCPGSGGREKCWHIDNYIATAGRLKKANYRPVFLLGAAEYERFDERQIDKLANAGAVIGGLSIEEVVGLLSAAAVYIGNDSGVSHISGTMHMPTVSVFGPTDPQMYKPPGTVSNAVKLSEEDFSRYSEKGVETVVAAAFDTIKNARTPMFEIHI